MNRVKLGAVMIACSLLLAANGAKATKSKSFARESPQQRIERIDAAKRELKELEAKILKVQEGEEEK